MPLVILVETLVPWHNSSPLTDAMVGTKINNNQKRYYGMCIGIDATTGKAMVVEFTRAGEQHRSVRWCSDAGLLDDMTSGESLVALKARYEAHGAEILKVSKLEMIEINCE